MSRAKYENVRHIKLRTSTVSIIRIRIIVGLTPV